MFIITSEIYIEWLTVALRINYFPDETFMPDAPYCSSTGRAMNNISSDKSDFCHLTYRIPATTVTRQQTISYPVQCHVLVLFIYLFVHLVY
jgi:hypothetical protein